ncbi:MAG: potassium channel protein [Dehalococcoidia bacterium]
MRTGFLSRRVPAALLVLLAIALVGVAWYMLAEGWDLLDAAYMVVISITTVGYEEVQPLDTSGRIFTLFFVPIGVGALLYVVGLTVEELVLGEVAHAFGLQRLNRRIERMRNHIVICGYGRVGQEVALELRERGEEILVIERDPAVAERARETEITTLVGDATDEAMLRQAHADTARVIVAAADSDAENAFVALTARALNPQIMIIARAGTESGERRLLAAGADRVISPAQIAGRRMALQAVQPLVVDFIDSVTRHGGLENRMFAEIVLGDETADLSGQSVAQVFGALRTCRLLGIERAGAEFIVAPAGNTQLRTGDRLMVYGDVHEMEGLHTAAGGTRLVSDPAS